MKNLRLHQMVQVEGKLWKVAEIRKDYVLLENPSDCEKFLFVTDASIIRKVA